ncbi:MAG: HAD-IC family P-type ATPase, partial [Cyclobacteriaceae bacterium]
DTLASEGLKVLGFAFRNWETKPGRFNEDLEFSGLIGFIDPARSDVPKAIQDCHNAGIRVIMATGDHPSTALAIAKQTGLTKGDESAIIQGADLDSLHGDEWTSRVSAADILSRVTPRQKLQVVTHYQEKGHIVGMTGDGVNDAPALKKSDIGIAMGMRGTQVAEEAADMVIQDDAFTSIVQAIRQGRIIFGNIKNFVIYLLSCNLSEIMVVSIATLFSTVLPLLPLQILFLNIVTDVFPALALGMGKGNEQVMHHSSRNPKDPILNKRNWRTIFLYAAALTASILAAYFYAIKLLDYDPLRVNTITFFALAFAQLTHPFSLPNGKEPFFANPVFTNRFLWGAIFLCTFLLLISIYIPILREILGLGIPSPSDWLIILLASIAPVLIIRSIKIVLRHE